MHLFIEALKNGILITSLVMIMMLSIEYINVYTKGAGFKRVQRSKFRQVLVGALLGAIPGCAGGFMVVSLYTHRLLSFGALVAMMIASSGDEAFIMLAIIPKEALILTLILFVLAIVVGLVTDLINKKEFAPFSAKHYQVHSECCSSTTTLKHNHTEGEDNKGVSAPNYFSKERVALLLGLILYIVAILFGILGHDHSPQEHMAELQGSSHHHLNILNEKWINIFFATVAVVVLYLILRSTHHFIKEHLWDHIIKKHFKTIFLWTFGTLLVINFGIQFLHVEQWISENIYFTILIAALVGLIPESGPHMLFVTLFATGASPFSVLLTNSIVQDGHATLPLLAESKRSFIVAKLINLVVGVTIGVLVQLVASI